MMENPMKMDDDWYPHSSDMFGNLHIPFRQSDEVFCVVVVHRFQSAEYGFGTCDHLTLTHYAYGPTQIQDNIATLSTRVKSHHSIS